MRGQLYIVKGWPGGFCPLHCGEDMPCNAGCLQARIEFAQAAVALDRYWLAPAGKRSYLLAA